MKKPSLSIIASGLLALPVLASADPIAVAYAIGDYNAGGFSASTLHSATGCHGVGPTTGDDLYMCGNRRYDDLTGTVYGTLYDDGTLDITGGSLSINDGEYDITGGGLGPFYAGGTTLGTIQIADIGTFYFEHLLMGSGLPNFFDGNTFILWGQNERAYCSPYECKQRRWGIDLYGERVAVSEPETLALFGLGLLALGISRRRRPVLVTNS